jgi:hypothetical protein
MSATAAVRTWVESTMGWEPERFGVHAAPHLSTPRYELVMITQRGVHHGGELYVMTDGSEVLPAGAASLGKVLAAEGPDTLDPRLVAELFFRMAEVGRGSPVSEPPPRAERDGDGMRWVFSSARSPGAPVERWTVRLRADGALSSEVETPANGGR